MRSKVAHQGTEKDFMDKVDDCILDLMEDKRIWGTSGVPGVDELRISWKGHKIDIKDAF